MWYDVGGDLCQAGSLSQKWAYSSTGTYMNKEAAEFIAENRFNLSVTDGDIYKTARLAPHSLKYYGLCMRRGKYKVRLHFAEIMFTNNQSFSSLGRRIFDISIQVSYMSNFYAGFCMLSLLLRF